MYEIGQIIGTGSYSTIRSITHKETGIKYARKETAVEFIEIDIISRHKHPNIIELIDFSVDESYDYRSNRKLSIFLILELGSSDLSRFEHKITNVMILDMIKVILFLHNNGVVHGDIKPENFVFVNGTIKLIDFGIGGYHDYPVHNLQTLPYAPPEILNTFYSVNIETAASYNSMMATDLWALGATIMYITAKICPFGNTDHIIESNINSYIRDPHQYLVQEEVPPEYFDLLFLLMDPDPITRLENVSQVIELCNISNPPVIPKSLIPVIVSEDETINHDAQFFIGTMVKYRFDTEIVFLAMDLYYRVIESFKEKFKRRYIAIACLCIAFQLGSIRTSSLDPLIICCSDNQTSRNELCQIAGKIAIFLKGELYQPNLYTGINNIEELRIRAKSLGNIKTYIETRNKLSKPHNVKKMRIPITLL